MSGSTAHVGIVGAGVVGLTSALLLTEAGHQVTVVARNLPGDTSTEWASPWAGALLAPNPDAGHNAMQTESILYWHSLLRSHPECGIREIQITEYYDDRSRESKIWYQDLYRDLKFFPTENLIPGASLGYTYRGLAVDPSVFLPWIFTQLHHRGVRFIKRQISSLSELQETIGADVLVNASGLGARELASDCDVHGVRGQTMFVPFSDDASLLLREATLFQGSHYTYAIPRQGSRGVILGGVSQRGDTRVEPDASLRSDILSRVNGLTTGQFSWVDLEKSVEKDIVGFRPARSGGLRVERMGNVVHAYGLGPLGYVFSWGVAKRVTALVQERSKPKL